MKTTKLIALCSIALLCGVQAQAQGTFENLNFEQATITPTPVDEYGSYANPAQAFPDWTIGGAATVVLYNSETLGSPAVDLIGPDFPNALGLTALQGSYSVLMQDFGLPPQYYPPPTLSQTGTLPTNAQSINFLASPIPGFGDAGIVELNGVAIPLVPISGGRLAGNISAWAGQTVQLTFTVPSTGENFFYFDDIEFSPTPVPEPRIVALTAIGGLFFGRRKWLARR